MSECKHESIDPYGCFCDGCGETCDEIIRNQQAELATLREGIQEGIYSLTCRRCWGAEQTIKLLQALLEVKDEH